MGGLKKRKKHREPKYEVILNGAPTRSAEWRGVTDPVKFQAGVEAGHALAVVVGTRLVNRTGFFTARLVPRHSVQNDPRVWRLMVPQPFVPRLPAPRSGASSADMRDVKDTLRALVRISYDGRVFKTFRGPKAEERFANEVRVLRHLEERGCPFVPRLLEADPAELRIVTTNCGSRVEHLDEARVRELFAELLPFCVRHEDADMRNVTYRQSDGRFCLIDFEFATILPDAENPDDGPAK